jgi:phosphatidylglycerol:prolipoprotein diacylglycerol transferase
VAIQFNNQSASLKRLKKGESLWHKLTNPDPRTLSYILSSLGIILAVILFYPISLVFSGQWKLNQKFDVINNWIIDLQSMGIGSIAEGMGIEPFIFIGTISIRFYAICMVVGMIAGYAMALYLAKRQFIASTVIDRLVIGLVISGLVGARLFFVAFNWSSYANNPITVVTEIMNGGLAIFGMVIFAGIYLWLYCKRYQFKYFEFLDIIAPSVLVGQIIGRWGNFFNYESYGPATNVFWKMFVPQVANYTDDLFAKYFHPTFIYEIIPNFILLCIILYNYEDLTRKHSGKVFALYAMGYGLIRFVTEFFRLDALTIDLPEFMHLNVNNLFTIEAIFVSQLAALALFGIGLNTWLKRDKVLFIKKNLQEVKIS